MRGKHFAHAPNPGAMSATGAFNKSDATPAAAGISPSVAPANENWPIVKLNSSGDGVALTRALVYVLVRRALISEGVFSVINGCDDQTRAG